MSKQDWKYALSGANGRMGLEIQSLQHLYHGVATLKTGKSFDWSVSPAETINVWIDFTHASAFDSVLKYCLKHNLPLMSGTTGLSDPQFADIKKASAQIPILWTSNTSIGIMIFKKLLKQFEGLQAWDFHLVEHHHTQKKDSPSGTAKSLQQDIQKIFPSKNIEISAIRGGSVYGIHELYAHGQDESIRIEHHVQNRSLFAKGALQAAQFLCTQKPGLYTMENILDANSKA